MNDVVSPEPGDQYVQSLARGLAVIRAFDADHPRMTLSEVAARAGVARAVARRLLHTLVALGYMRTDERHFELTSRILELGFSFLATQPLATLAEPVIRELSEITGESVTVATLDGSEIVYIACIHRRRILAVDITVGTRFPAYATSLGRVLLAALPASQRDAAIGQGPLHAYTEKTVISRSALKQELARVSEQGWASIDQELDFGLWALAAPVRDSAGNVVAAVGFSMQVNHNESDSARNARGKALLPHLLEAAERLSHVARAH